MPFLILLTLTQLGLQGQSDRAFRTAIGDESTAPYFVLITVVDDSTGVSRAVCTEAPFLLGAIHIERRIPYNDRGSRRVQKIALSTRGHIFHFSNPNALANIPIPYSDSLLLAARGWVEAFAKDQLVADLVTEPSPVHKFYRSRKGDDRLAYKLALAHALLERGLVVRRGCIVDDLIVDKE